MSCPICGHDGLAYFRLLGGDLEAVCAGCGDHAHYVEVDYAAG